MRTFDVLMTDRIDFGRNSRPHALSFQTFLGVTEPRTSNGLRVQTVNQEVNCDFEVVAQAIIISGERMWPGVRPATVRLSSAQVSRNEN